MAARPRRRPRAVQDLLDLRFHRRRQYRPGHGCAARRFRRRDRAGDAGLPGNRPHRLSGQSVRRLRAAERKPAEGSSAQPDARFQSGAGAGAPEPDQGRPGRSCDARRAARMPFARGLPISPARALAPPSSMPCSTAISKPSAAVALDHRLSVGASGIGLGLARALVASGKVKSNAASATAGAAGRRTGGVPCRQLFAGDAAADRERREDDAGAASRSRTDHRRAGRSAARAGLGERANQRRPDPDREQFDAGSGRSSAISSWPRCSRTCHRAGDGRYRRRPGAVGRAAIGGRRW